jgi:RNA polymerase sigma-70 factor, ECF subfamily
VDDIDRFITDHYEAVRRAIALAIGDPGRAEEVTQEAFSRALERWGQVSVMDRPVAWVYVVALNAARRDLKRSSRKDGDFGRIMESVDASGRVATAVSVRTAVATLPARQRAAVVLRYLADLSVAEVAGAMGCAEGTVKSTLHAALGRLRIELGDDDE